MRSFARAGRWPRALYSDKDQTKNPLNLLLFCCCCFETWGFESCKQFSTAMSRCFFFGRTAFVSPSFENVDPDDDELVDELDEGRNL